jgi:hypothetical protein
MLNLIRRFFIYPCVVFRKIIVDIMIYLCAVR